jgi:hypothetical protein
VRTWQWQRAANVVIPDISQKPQFTLEFVAPGPPAPVSRVLDISVMDQMRTNWCWAAVGLAIRVVYKTAGSLRQCHIASEVLGAKCCPQGKGCNETHRLRAALGIHHVSTLRQPGHQTIDFVREEIDSGNPVCVRIHRRHSGSGHFVVIAGYCVTSIGDFLWVRDPDGGTTRPWAFNQFLLHYLQNGFWHLSFQTGHGTANVQIGGPECR